MTTYLFKPDFYPILNEVRDRKGLHATIPKFELNQKYSIESVYEFIIITSNKIYSRYYLDNLFADYFRLGRNTKMSCTQIKDLIKKETLNIIDDDFVNKYVVIGYDQATIIKELTVVL